MTERLDPLTLPLRGSRLIEASAGTGKTWTIAALYLRLVLGHGEPALEPPLEPRSPAQILVMTFTRAATRELSSRIRQRLSQAAALFRGEAAEQADKADDFLLALRGAYPEGPVREAAAWRLAAAADAMDDAAVFTLDAWCQRMLREHAFDSGSLFDETLAPDETEWRAAAARDYWRQQVLPLQGWALDTVLAQWPQCDALQRQVGPLLGKVVLPEAPPGTLGEWLAAFVDERRRVVGPMKLALREAVPVMRAWFAREFDPATPNQLNHNSIRRDTVVAWLGVLDDWAHAVDALDAPTPPGTSRKRPYDPAELRAAVRKGVTLELPPAFDVVTQAMAALQAQPDPAPLLAAHAAQGVGQRLQQIKAAAGCLGFADLLQRLADALDPQARPEAAAQLRRRILAQYPVALVDEFQDTAPTQLQVLDRLYRIAEPEPGHALLLIGDPKQAIYRFRGADLPSYLRARRLTDGRHHVLDTNHRSTEALVRSVNALFERAEQHVDGGAFQTEGPDRLPFVAVRAQGRPERLVRAGLPLPATAWSVDTTPSHRRIVLPRDAARAAEQIVALLNDPTVGFEQGDGRFERLRPAQIAVLVRQRDEAAAVREALRVRSVPSVYLSDRDSVFATEEAHDLLRLLQAVAAPQDLRRLRAALATGLLGFSLPQLHALADDDAALDVQAERLRELQAVWTGQGVLALVRRALHAFNLPSRWLAADTAAGGERRLTHVLHLAELLQAASATQPGPSALLRWFAQQIEEGDLASADDRILRLESDAERVQVVTVHKSKGLEYPVVFLPFAAPCRPFKWKRGMALERHDAQGGLVVDLQPADEDKARPEIERLQEDLRLLYVALTRARHTLWLGVAALRIGNAAGIAWHRSALGVLLGGATSRGPEQVLADVQAYAAAVGPALAQVHDATPPESAPGPAEAGRPPRGSSKVAEPHLLESEGHEDVPTPVTRWRPEGTPPPLGTALRCEASFDRSWSLASYSSLVRDAGGGAAAAPLPALALQHLQDDDPESPPAAVSDPAAPAEPTAGAPAGAPALAPWHRFPRGALAGNFLHGLLEALAAEGFALDDSPALQRALRRRCEREGHGERADDVMQWLRRVCRTPLAAFGVPLAGLQRVLPEMEFWLPSAPLRASEVDALCREHLLPGRDRPRLPQRELHGLLMGFADLVFEHEGRYAVLDYKSNALGLRDADYSAEALQSAMLAHRYDVQAALYLLALHRLLRARLGAAYRPAQQLAGATYLFLRGVAGPQAGCCHLEAPLPLLDALDALLEGSSP